MPWYANQIYLLPTASAMRVLQKQPSIAGLLFYLDNIQGVWSEVGRENAKHVVSDFDNPVPEQLPPEGLLVVDPIVSWSNVLADQTPGFTAFIEQIGANERSRRYWPPSKRWAGLKLPKGAYDVPVPASCATDVEDTSVLQLCRMLADQGETNALYYVCEMSGGDVVMEWAWHISASTSTLYAFQNPDHVETYREGSLVDCVQGDALHLGLGHLGIKLQSGYFAPHATFNWMPYHIAPSWRPR